MICTHTGGSWPGRLNGSGLGCFAYVGPDRLGLGIFFVKVSKLSPNSILRASSSQRFSSRRKSWREEESFGSSAAFRAHCSACCKHSRICSLRLFNMVRSLAVIGGSANRLSVTDARILLACFLPAMMNPTLSLGDARRHSTLQCSNWITNWIRKVSDRSLTSPNRHRPRALRAGAFGFLTFTQSADFACSQLRRGWL